MILSIYIDDIMDKDDAKEVAEYFGVIPENSEGKIAMCFQDVNEKKTIHDGLGENQGIR